MKLLKGLQLLKEHVGQTLLSGVLCDIKDDGGQGEGHFR